MVFPRSYRRPPPWLPPPPPREELPPVRAAPRLEYPWSLCIRAAPPSRTPPKALLFPLRTLGAICRLPIRSAAADGEVMPRDCARFAEAPRDWSPAEEAPRD